MKIGVPREVKVKEHRVACTPGGARMLANEGHTVLVQAGAGEASGFPDIQYVQAGARSHIALICGLWSMTVRLADPNDASRGFSVFHSRTPLPGITLLRVLLSPDVPTARWDRWGRWDQWRGVKKRCGPELAGGFEGQAGVIGLLTGLAARRMVQQESWSCL